MSDSSNILEKALAAKKGGNYRALVGIGQEIVDMLSRDAHTYQPMIPVLIGVAEALNKDKESSLDARHFCLRGIESAIPNRIGGQSDEEENARYSQDYRNAVDTYVKLVETPCGEPHRFVYYQTLCRTEFNKSCAGLEDKAEYAWDAGVQGMLDNRNTVGVSERIELFRHVGCLPGISQKNAERLCDAFIESVRQLREKEAQTNIFRSVLASTGSGLFFRDKLRNEICPSSSETSPDIPDRRKVRQFLDALKS